MAPKKVTPCAVALPSRRTHTQKRPKMESWRCEALHVYDNQVRIETLFSQVSGN